MPTLTIKDNQVVIPSEILHSENGDRIDLIDKNDNTFILKIKPKDFQCNKSFMDIINSVKGHKSFNNTQEIDDFIIKERDSWD